MAASSFGSIPCTQLRPASWRYITSRAADGLVAASPVYYASANATLVACLARLFYSTPFDKTMKVGASIACARRGGCSATFDELNKFFTIQCKKQLKKQLAMKMSSLKSPAPFLILPDKAGLHIKDKFLDDT